MARIQNETVDGECVHKVTRRWGRGSKSIRLCAGCGEEVALTEYDRNQDALNRNKVGPVS